MVEGVGALGGEGGGGHCSGCTQLRCSGSGDGGPAVPAHHAWILPHNPALPPPHTHLLIASDHPVDLICPRITVPVPPSPLLPLPP